MRAIWTPNRSTITAMVLPGTEETSYELTWSYPIGIGIALNDFLGRN